MSYPTVDVTHDPKRASWVESARGHADFPIQNLPLGVFSADGGAPRIGAAIGDEILDLKAVCTAGLIDPEFHDALGGDGLNDWFALPAASRSVLRARISALLSDPALQAAVEPHLHPAPACVMHLPARIGDYTDFYVGIHHATNIGRLFRPDSPLLPNYKHIPIGYHGRASSVRVSGTPLVRPLGQTKAPDAATPRFGPCERLDYELEMAVWVGRGNALGATVPIGEASAHIAGFGLLNDWSARDIQAWEYQPLGPFLAKNFLTTVSPWVVTAEAMAPFFAAQPARPEGDPQPLPYLSDDADQARGALAVALSVHLASARMRAEGLDPIRLSQGPATNMYWTVAQMLTHHASNGCNLSSGDLLGTGTISGETPDAFGSLMEISQGGKAPITLPTGETRAFLADGDEVIFTARAEAEGFAPIGFGECRGVVMAAR